MTAVYRAASRCCLSVAVVVAAVSPALHTQTREAAVPGRPFRIPIAWILTGRRCRQR